MNNPPKSVWQALLAILDKMPPTAGATGGGSSASSLAKSMPIRISAAGDNVVISPSTPTKSLRISGLYFVCASAVDVTFKESTFPITGVMLLTDHAVDYFYPLSFAPGEDFVINLGSAIAVNGYVVFWEV